MVKHNPLIEAAYKLTLPEQRLILSIASTITTSDKDFYSYQISLSALNDILKINNESQIKSLIKKLMNRKLIIEEMGYELHTAWLSSVIYMNENVEICFDPKLKQYFISMIKYFTRYQLEPAIYLKSIYAIRIYELLKQYQEFRKKSFKLNKLRDILGIASEKYKLYADFKRKVLNTAFKEINKKTDISFNFKEIKTGRKVTEIIFEIQSKDENALKIREKQANLDDWKKRKAAVKALSKEEYKKLRPEAIKRLKKQGIKNPKESTIKTEIGFLIFDN
ncbi:hypothetical protein GMMP15_90061 [Candidatus Magnetomoraceae bacterium gMMP-15]